MIPPQNLLLGLFVAALQTAGASSPVPDRADFTVIPPGQTRQSVTTPNVVPIPEPTSAVLGLIATAVILLRRRLA